MSGDGSARSEVEATLAVCSEEPEADFEELFGLERAGPYRLRWRGETVLRDVYLEARDGGLGERGLALRLRREGGAWSVTLKGDERRAPGGAVERTEVEGAWTEEGAAAVAAELERRGLDADGLRAAAGRPEPVEAMRRRGFRVVQDRRTRRRRAGVSGPGGSDGDAAEIAADAVAYRAPGGGRVVHREVEVEAAPGAPAELPGRVAAELRERLGGRLRPWPHSKLATGRALAEVDPPAGPAGALRPDAYDELERRIGDGSA